MRQFFSNEYTSFGVSLAEALRYRNLPEGWRVDWRREPTRFKSYESTYRIALDPYAPLEFSGTSRRILAPPDGDAATLTRLSHWLLLCSGLSHSRIGMPVATTDPAAHHPDSGVTSDEILPSFYPMRRPAPSGGALYPYELYLHWPGTTEAAKGVYHYDAFTHALEPVAPHVEGIGSRLTGRRLNADAALLVITAAFWKNEFKYGNAAVSLSLLDIGVLLGQLMKLAPFFGLSADAQLDFPDEAVDRLLELDPRQESPIVIVNAAVPESGTVDCPPVGDGAPNFAKAHVQATPACTLVGEYFLASRLHVPEMRSMTAQSIDSGNPTSRISLFPSSAPRKAHQNDALHLRGRASGIHPHKEAFLPLQTLADLCGEQFADPGWLCLPRIRPEQLLNASIVAPRVAGLASGVYRYCHRASALECVYEDDPDSLSQGLQNSYNLKNIGFGVASAVVFLTCRYRNVIATFGNRGYRHANIMAGIIVHRTYSFMADLRLGCHAILGFNDLSAEKLLQLPPRQEHLVVGIALGEMPEKLPFLRMPLWI